MAVSNIAKFFRVGYFCGTHTMILNIVFTYRLVPGFVSRRLDRIFGPR